MSALSFLLFYSVLLDIQAKGTTHPLQNKLHNWVNLAVGQLQELIAIVILAPVHGGCYTNVHHSTRELQKGVRRVDTIGGKQGVAAIGELRGHHEGYDHRREAGFHELELEGAHPNVARDC